MSERVNFIHFKRSTIVIFKIFWTKLESSKTVLESSYDDQEKSYCNLKMLITFHTHFWVHQNKQNIYLFFSVRRLVKGAVILKRQIIDATSSSTICGTSSRGRSLLFNLHLWRQIVSGLLVRTFNLYYNTVLPLKYGQIAVQISILFSSGDLIKILMEWTHTLSTSSTLYWLAMSTILLKLICNLHKTHDL